MAPRSSSTAPARRRSPRRRRDGQPHVAPIWFVLDNDGSVVFTTAAEAPGEGQDAAPPRPAGGALRRRQGSTPPPFAFVLIEGTAIISADLDEMLGWATRIGGRYMGDDRAEAFGRRNAVEGELLVRVTPERVVARRRDVAD